MKFKNAYELLKEAREGWDYFVSDKVVYEGKFVNTHRAEHPIWIDSYLVGDIWFEACIHISDESGVVMLIENCDNATIVRGKRNLGTHVTDRNDPVFIRVRQQFKISEEVEFRPILSIVWLKTFDFTMCTRVDMFNSAFPDVTPLRCLKAQGESNAPLLGGCKFNARLLNIQHGKLPSNMVKRIPQVCNNISYNQPPSVGSQGRINAHINPFGSLKDALRYGLFADGMLWVERTIDASFKSAHVYIRPVNLEPSATESLQRMEKARG